MYPEVSEQERLLIRACLTQTTLDCDHCMIDTVHAYVTNMLNPLIHYIVTNETRWLCETYLVVLSRKHLHPHDGEYEPKDEAHQQHVENAWDRLHQGIYHDLLNESIISSPRHN